MIVANTIRKEELEKIMASKNLNKALLNRLPFADMLIRKDRIVVAANNIAASIGVEVGKQCWHTFGKCASLPQQDKEYFDKHGKAPEIYIYAM